MIEGKQIQGEEIKQYLELDFEEGEEFKEIASLASELCEMPVSLITLVGEEMSCIKIGVGFAPGKSPREISFCHYAVQQDELLVVPDATTDSRFCNNPLVTESPKVRFYAGAPLMLSNGSRLGTLCLFDFKPNNLSTAQKKILSVLSKQVVHLMELELSRKQLLQGMVELETKNESLRQVAHMQSHQIRHPLSSIMGLVDLVKSGLMPPDRQWLDMMVTATNMLDDRIHAIVNESMGNRDLKLLQFNKVVEEIEDYAILLLDETGNIENWNAGAQTIKGYRSDEIVGKHFSTFYDQTDRSSFLPEKLLQEARINKVARAVGWRVRSDGSKFWASVVITSIHNDDREVIGFIKVTRDLTNVRNTQYPPKAAEDAPTTQGS